MKVAINKCHGGFGLSARAVKRWAELQGRECYFFEGHKQRRISDEEAFANKHFLVLAYDVPDLSVLPSQDNWHSMSMEDRVSSNAEWDRHQIAGDRRSDRSDPLLIQVIEELGDVANGPYAKLAVVEIPDGVEYEIDEYDGFETIHEKHRVWGLRDAGR